MEIRTFLKEPAKVAEAMYKVVMLCPSPQVYNPRDIHYFSNFKRNIFRRFIIFPTESFRPSTGLSNRIFSAKRRTFQPNLFGQAPDFPTESFRPSAGLSNRILSAKHQTFQPNPFGQAPDFPTESFRPSTGLSNRIFSARHRPNPNKHIPLYSVIPHYILSATK